MHHHHHQLITPLSFSAHHHSTTRTHPCFYWNLSSSVSPIPSQVLPSEANHFNWKKGCRKDAFEFALTSFLDHPLRTNAPKMGKKSHRICLISQYSHLNLIKRNLEKRCGGEGGGEGGGENGKGKRERVWV